MSEKEFKFNFANNVEEAEHENSHAENEREEEEVRIIIYTNKKYLYSLN